MKDPNKLKPEEHNTRQMLGVAKTFLMCAKKCNEPPAQQHGWTHPLLIPIITNAAFSCELFLKTLLAKHNIPKKKHKLDELFEALPEDIKKEIIGFNDRKNILDFFLILRKGCLVVLVDLFSQPSI